MEVGNRCQGALASLDREVRRRTGVEEEVRVAARYARALAERAGEPARFLRDAACRLAEADRQEMSIRGDILGISAPLPFWRLPEMMLSGLPFIPVPRIVLPPAGAVLGGLTAGALGSAASGLMERAWNRPHGYGWKTNAEPAPPPQASTVREKGKWYETIMRGLSGRKHPGRLMPPRRLLRPNRSRRRQRPRPRPRPTATMSRSSAGRGDCTTDRRRRTAAPLPRRRW